MQSTQAFRWAVTLTTLALVFGGLDMFASAEPGGIFANFAGTLGLDAGGMALAAAGMLDPVVAAFIHVSSELLFLLNAARLLRRPATAPAVTTPLDAVAGAG